MTTRKPRPDPSQIAQRVVDEAMGDIPGLFGHWLALEKAAGKSMTDILADINSACGTRYRHNWPSKLAVAGYELKGVSREVRQYMVWRVLEAELKARGKRLSGMDLDAMTKALT